MIVYAEPKTCAACEVTLPAPDCFAVARRSGEKVWRRGTCRRCVNARTPWTPEKRRRQAELAAALSPEEKERRRGQQRESKRRRMATSQETRSRTLARQRRYRRRKAAEDPEWKRRQYARVNDHKRAKRAELRRTMEKLEAEMKMRLPVAPLLAYLDEKLQEVGTEVLADTVALQSKTFRRWRTGEVGYVRLEVADRILTRLGEPYLLDVLWPDVDERLAGTRPAAQPLLEER